VPLWLGLGEALEAQGKLDAAQQAYGDAQKLAPTSALLLERRARLAARRGQPDEARKLFDEALKLGSPTASLRLAAAQLALDSGRGADARALADSVLKEDERSALANLILARTAIEAGNPEEAVGLARRAVTLQDLPEAHLVLAQVLEATNKLEGASAEYSLARRAPTVERATLGRARILVRMGATRDALAEIAPLTKSGALRGEALVIEGDCYSDLQQTDKARHSYEEASKLSPPIPDALFKLGRALLDAGKRRPAIDALTHAIKLATPKTSWLAEAYQLLGDAHRSGKEDAQAIAAYQKFLSLAPRNSAARAEIERNIKLLGGTP
jgi:tetratricopeptide (TPR) repeat protein